MMEIANKPALLKIPDVWKTAEKEMLKDNNYTNLMPKLKPQHQPLKEKEKEMEPKKLLNKLGLN
jgi:hypothetical protein